MQNGNKLRKRHSILQQIKSQRAKVSGNAVHCWTAQGQCLVFFFFPLVSQTYLFNLLLSLIVSVCVSDQISLASLCVFVVIMRSYRLECIT